MRIAHAVVITPGKCGLYETARELAHGLCSLGEDARLVDPSGNSQSGSDRGVPIADLEWAKSADVIVNHSGLDGSLDKQETPVIHVCHGRPQYSFDGERSGGTPVYSYQYRMSKNPRFKAVVTFWEQHLAYHAVMWGGVPVRHVPAPCDLTKWCPGPSNYQFNGKRGKINVIITDPWREDIDPFTAINAFAVFRTSHPEAKLHIYGVQGGFRGIDALIQPLRDTGNVGEVLPWVSGLENVYRSADMMITPHKIHTRSIREAWACGCKTVTGMDCDPFDILAFAAEMEYRIGENPNVRQWAESLFDPKRTATKFREVIESVVLQCQ